MQALIMTPDAMVLKSWHCALDTSVEALVKTKILKVYRIAGNFRLEKIFAQARRGRKCFRRIILPSENFVTRKYLHAQVFTRGCQALLVVPHDRQSAGIQPPSFSICSLA